MSLKYNDPNHNTVRDTVTGDTFIPCVWTWGAKLQPRLDAGETIAPWKSEGELLEEARAAKIAEVNVAFAIAETQSVTVGNNSYKGGFESGLAIDAQRRAMLEYSAVNPLAGITTVDFFDVNGVRVTLPLSSEDKIDALDVCLALHQSAVANAFKCAQLIAAIHAATTLSEVEAITW